MAQASRNRLLSPRPRLPQKASAVRHTRCQWAEFYSNLLSRVETGGKRCRVVSGAAGNWEGWQDKEPYTTAQYPDVSLLTQTEKDMLLSLLPSSEQIQFISKGSTTAVTWLAAALIFLIAASKNTAIAVVGGTYPFYGNVLTAAYKNFSFKNSTKRYVGIWHARVLSLSIEDSYPGNGDVATSLNLSIGEPGTDGYSSELQVPWSPGSSFIRGFNCASVGNGLQALNLVTVVAHERCEQLRKADQVEALVMSTSQYFEEFVVVRDVYIPALRVWLADYPFIKRNVFEQLSEDVYWSRQDGENEQSPW